MIHPSFTRQLRECREAAIARVTDHPSGIGVAIRSQVTRYQNGQSTADNGPRRDSN